MLGQRNAFFTKTAFWLWVGNALYHSVVRILFSCMSIEGIYCPLQVAFGFSVILFWGDLKSSRGYDCGHWFWGTTLYIAVLLTVLGKAALVSECVHGCAIIPSTLLMAFISQHMDEVYCCRCDPRQRGRCSNAHLTSSAIPGSFAFTMLFLPIYIVIAPSIGFSLEYWGLDPQLFTDSVFWFTILLIPAICLCRDFVWK